MAAQGLTLTEQIRQLIEGSDLAPYRIARECQIDPGLMSRFMAGKATFSMPTLDRLADYLGWQIVSTKETKQRKARRVKE